MSTGWKDMNYDSIFVIIGLHDEPMQISWCNQVAGDNFKHCNSMSRFPRVSNQDSIFTSKFWFPKYYFQARLQLHAFELDRVYHPYIFYEDIEWESHDYIPQEPSA